MDRPDKSLVRGRIDRPMPHLDFGRVSPEIIVAFPVFAWPNRPGTESATAIRTDISQNILDAGPAKGALKTADHGLGRIRRESLVTIFADRS